MIFSLFWEGAFIRRGAFILKSEILGGRSFEGAFIRRGAFIRGNTVCYIIVYVQSEFIEKY